MRILVVNQFFYPDISAVAQQLTDLAEDLTAAGHQITVVCGRGAYQAGSRPLPPREIYQGIEIRRVSSPNLGKRNVLTLLSFYILAFWEMLRAPRPDLIYVLSTPPLILLPALVAGRLRGLPVVYGIHDHYPDIAVALGVLSPDGWLTRLLRAVSVAAMRRAGRLVVLGRFARERLVAQGLDGNKITVLENWADARQIQPITRADNWFLRRFGLEEKFVALYSGNIGLAHEFSTLLEAARRLASHPEIVFLFVGDGARRKEVEEFRDRHGLPNLVITGYQDRADLSYSLSAGDVFLVTLRAGCEGMALPSKVYAGMAAARPLLFIGSQENDTAETIAKAGCGWILPPGDAGGVVDKIMELKQNPGLAQEYGLRGRRALEEHYFRGHATAGYVRVFAAAVNEKQQEYSE